MGGGEFVRAAAKMAGAATGTGAVNAGLRGSSAVPPFGQLLRTASKPSSVFVGSSSPVQPAKATPGAEVDVVRKPTWEFDDWEFANFENDMGMDSAGFKPRIVFGAVPSFEEAKEATTEVKEALDKVYLSSSPESDGSNMIVTLNRKIESVSCETSLQSQTSVPQHAIQAFKLLKESAEAQTVVASIASDPNVWNAMLGNEALKSFLQSYQTNKIVEFHESPEGVEEAPVSYRVDEQPQNESTNVFQKMLENIKTSIDDMLAKASSFIQIIFGSSPADVSGRNDEATSGFSTAEIAMGSSIMGLVVIVVAVLLVKRS